MSMNSLNSTNLSTVTISNRKHQQFMGYDFEHDSKFQEGWRKVSAVLSTSQVEEKLLKAKLFYYSKHIESFSEEEYIDCIKQAKINQEVASTTIPLEDVLENIKLRSSTGNNEKISTQTFMDKCSLNDLQIPESKYEETTGIKAEKLSKGTETSTFEENRSLNLRETTTTTSENRSPNLRETTPTSEANSSLNIRETTLTSEENSSPNLSLVEVAELIEKGKPIPGVADLNIKPLDVNPAPSEMMKPKKPWEL